MTDEGEPAMRMPRRARKVRMNPEPSPDGRVLMDDAEAHRDVTYSMPSPVGQTLAVFMMQMKLYAKSDAWIMMLMVTLAIPFVTLVSSVNDVMLDLSTGGTSYMGTALLLFPVMLGLFTASLCGTPIGREFGDRTAYLNIPLPVSRTSFYLGKYAAGLVLCLGLFMLAYGMALVAALLRFDAVDSSAILSSTGIMAVSVFAFTATAFGLGSITRGPTVMLPFLLMTVLLPVFFVYVAFNQDATWMLNLPVYLPDMALAELGAPYAGSVSGLFAAMGADFSEYQDFGTMVAAALLWGLAFLLLGLFATRGREM